MKHERSIQGAPQRAANELHYIAAVAVTAALLIASSRVDHPSSATLIGAYTYWIVRIAIESTFFVLARDALMRSFQKARSAWMIPVAAMLISLVPFVLAITALDIVLGYPELGVVAAAGMPTSKVKEFGFEVWFLLDNHMFLCLLLSIPRLFGLDQRLDFAAALNSPQQTAPAIAAPTALLTELDPPLKGELLWAEAQEHYVRFTTSEETRMVLVRFGDVLRSLPESVGIQVHRSHWIAINAIKEAFTEGANLRLRLRTDDTVPVSRSYRAVTEQRLKEANLTISL